MDSQFSKFVMMDSFIDLKKIKQFKIGVSKPFSTLHMEI